MAGSSDHAIRISVQEQPAAPVVCPHCRAALTDLDARPLHPEGGAVFGFGKRYLYSCPSCHSALGVSHRKGFWMG